MDIQSLKEAFIGGLDVETFYRDLLAKIDASDPKIWISRMAWHQLKPYLARLQEVPVCSLPLWGIPFAIKDNIDLVDLPTTAACPDFQYQPNSSATVVQRLIGAGAVPLGKTNLDQFATGLVGTRSPYGIPENVLDSKLIPGGSSSGSAVAVARDLATFSLGTDTAGSGRVPAALNGIFGLKPTRGLISCKGVVPACKSLDCVSVFTNNLDDAETLLPIVGFFDFEDPYSRSKPEEMYFARPSFTFGIPHKEQLNFWGNKLFQEQYEKAVAHMIDRGGRCVEVDYAPFDETAKLLYEGPWVAERYTAICDLIESKPEALYPVTRAIIEKGKDYTAVDTFNAMYRLETLRQKVKPVWEEIDFLLLPTAGLAPTIEAVKTDPVVVNSKLGTYTNFVNLLDLCGIAVPADPKEGLPFGITLLAPAFHDQKIIEYARHYLSKNEQ